ncbi:MAG TPA: hypothetical protein VMX54_16860 [Vicinamibacteria bacterium]|nr:hypothetical protein [Vicinamibacteria bacterium]
MRTTVGVFSLILAGLLACWTAPASAADDQMLVQAVSRDTGVPTQKLQQQKTDTGLSWDSVRTGHLLAEAMHRDFAEVAEKMKAGTPWHVIAREAGVSKSQLDRLARQHRQSPQPQR